MPRPRCSRCLRPESHCLCALIPQLDSRTRILLLQHPDEVHHALNTARFLALGLASVQLEVGETFADLERWLSQPGYRPALLFPGEQAQALAPYGADDAPWLLVVLDGTWRKARKLIHCNPLLASLPRVTIAAGGPSRYRLRKAPDPAALSTLEASVRALEALEGEGRFQALLKPFEVLIEGQIQAMGDEVFERNHRPGTDPDPLHSE